MRLLLVSAKALQHIVGMKYIKRQLRVRRFFSYRAIAKLASKLGHHILRGSGSGHY